jgi:hypothetical protein
MEQRSRSWGSNRFVALVFMVVTQASPLLSSPIFAETSVYRCSTPDGKVEFRQTACGDGSEEREITVEDEKTGWKPQAARIEKKPKRAEKSGTRKRKADRTRQASQARQEETCWKKRQALEEVNWKLRRGYKPAAGVKLRHKRRVHEEYLRRFCE